MRAWQSTCLPLSSDASVSVWCMYGQVPMQTASMSLSSSSAFQCGIRLRDVELRGDALARGEARVRHRHQLAFGDAAKRRDHHVAHVLAGADDPEANRRGRGTLRAGRAGARCRLDASGAGAERRRHRQHAEFEKLATPHRAGVRAICSVCHAVPPGGAIDALSSTDATAEPDVGRRFSSRRAERQLHVGGASVHVGRSVGPRRAELQLRLGERAALHGDGRPRHGSGPSSVSTCRTMTSRIVR